MAPWKSSGDILRWWRADVLGLTQQEAADRLNVRASAVSNWERGTRSVSVDLADLDEALKGEHVLEGLLWAYSTRRGLEPGHTWSKVFPGPSHPVWLWLRSPSDKLYFEGEWGVTRLETELELGQNGLFVTVGASIADSPVVVHFSERGWADFGSGELPGEIPGAPVVSAVEMFEKSTADGAFMNLFSSNIESKLSAGSPDVTGLAEASPDSVESYLRSTDRTAVPSRRRWPPVPERVDQVERARFAALRRARGLSLISMADRLTAITDIDVGRDTLRRFETAIGKPHDPMLPVALDHVLGADGRLAMVELRSGSGSSTVGFPAYWRGPIWIRLDDPRSEGRVLLRRGNWQRELTFAGQTIAAAHWFDPSLPLRIEADGQTSWAVGVGRRAGAEVIDQNWIPSALDVAQQALAETEQAIFTALDRRPKK